jgi:hypothetical protein
MEQRHLQRFLDIASLERPERRNVLMTHVVAIAVTPHPLLALHPLTTQRT